MKQIKNITAAITDSITAPAPAHTVTVTWANGTRATYSANLLDLLRTDPAALDIQDDSTGEMVYIKPDDQKVPAITPAEKIQACNIIIRRGGYRERDLLTRPHEITRGETWNAEHKVVNVTETTPDPDGYRAGCAVDLVTRSIVG